MNTTRKPLIGGDQRFMLFLCAMVLFLFSPFFALSPQASAAEGDPRIVQIEYGVMSSLNYTMQYGLIKDDASLIIKNAEGGKKDCLSPGPEQLASGSLMLGAMRKVKYSLAPGTYSYEATVRTGQGETDTKLAKGYFVVDVNQSDDDIVLEQLKRVHADDR
jgi:hypothetical protein